MKRIKWLFAWVSLRPSLWVHRLVTIASLIALVYLGVSISTGRYYDDSAVGRWLHQRVAGRSDAQLWFTWPPCYAIDTTAGLRIVDVDESLSKAFLGEHQDRLFEYMQGENRAGFLAPVRVQTVHRLKKVPDAQEFDFSFEQGLLNSWHYRSLPDQDGILAIERSRLDLARPDIEGTYYDPFRVHWGGYVINALALIALSGCLWSLRWTPAMIREQAVQIRLGIRYRKIRRDKCPDCGYDISGTRGKCPECGWGHEDMK